MSSTTRALVLTIDNREGGGIGNAVLLYWRMLDTLRARKNVRVLFLACSMATGIVRSAICCFLQSPIQRKIRVENEKNSIVHL